MTFDSFVKKFDRFGKEIAFREHGRDKLKSRLGAFLSILFAVAVFSYGARQFQVMIEYGDSKFEDYVEKNVLKNDLVLSYDET